MKWHLNVERGIPFLEVVIVILPGVFNNKLGYKKKSFLMTMFCFKETNEGNQLQLRERCNRYR